MKENKQVQLSLCGQLDPGRYAGFRFRRNFCASFVCEPRPVNSRGYKY